VWNPSFSGSAGLFSAAETLHQQSGNLSALSGALGGCHEAGSRGEPPFERLLAAGEAEVMTMSTLTSLVLDGASRTNAGTVTFTATFSAPLSGLSASNFTLGTVGTLAGTVIDSVVEKVPGDTTTYTITVSTGTGEGALSLAFDPTGVTDSDGNPLDTGANGLDFNISSTGAVAAAQYVEMADLNGDGKVDLVTSDYGGSVAVLLNNGDGSFAPSANYAASMGTSDLAVGDVNGDGKADIVSVTSMGVGAASVLLNNGDGTFAPQATYAANPYSYGVALGDLNGDGLNDIFTASQGDGKVAVLLNNGDGTFAPSVDLGSQSSLYSIVVADLNGDGKIDVAAASNGGQVGVMLNNGDGTFAPRVNYTTPAANIAIAAADLNGDGKVDLVTGNQLGSVSVLLNNGDGTFVSQDYTLAGSHRTVALVDMNGDGKTDIVTSAYNSPSNVSVLLNNGDGTFAASLDYPVSDQAFGVAAGDVNGDGLADIVTTFAMSGGYAVLEQQPIIQSADVTLDHTDATGTASLQGAPGGAATTLTYDLTFSEEVANLDAGDFTLLKTGTADGIVSITGSGSSYTVTVSGITGTGSVALALASDATVTDLAGNSVSLSPMTPHLVDAVPPDAPTLRTPHALTADARPIFAGVAEAGSTIHLYDTDGITVIGTTTADAQGNWVLRRTAAPLSDGPHSITATATDAAGNISLAAAPVLVMVDTVAPNAPIVAALPLTNTASPLLSGTAEAFSTVKVYDGETLLGTTNADISGSWSLNLSAPLAEGPHSIAALAADAVGHVSPASVVQLVMVDLTAPEVPALDTLPALGNTPITTLTGTAEAGATVEVFDGTTSIGTATANLDGLWSLLLDTPLTNGAHSLTAAATDPAGNASASSVALELTIDTLIPAAPTIAPLLPTSDNTPTLSGIAEAGSTVEVFDGLVSLGTAVAGENGAWTLDLSAPLGDGIHALTATATDTAGNASSPSLVLPLTIDTAAPAAPTIDVVPQENLDNTPVFFGTAEPLSFVDVYDGDTLLQRVQADASGDWWLIVPSALADGEHSLTAKAVDGANNISDASEALSLVINAAPPAAPVITDGDSPTNASILALHGTAEAGSTVEVFDGLASLGEATADSEGNWSLTLGAPLAEGPHSLTAVATDADGLSSDPSEALSILVDQTVPDMPAIDAIDDLGNTPIASLSGTAEADATVEIFDGAVSLGTVQANGSGVWTLVLGTPLGEGDHSLTAVATDAAGNASQPSAEMAATVDLTAPDAPGFDAFGSAINDTTPSLSGTAEAGSTVEVFDGTASLGTVQANEDGVWTLALTAPLDEGDHSLTAVATDAAGNASEASAELAFAVDLTGPDAPGFDTFGSVINNATPTLSGSAEAGSTVEVFEGAASLGTALANEEGVWTLALATLLDEGGHSLTAVATDAAGNPSTASTELVFAVDLTAPDAPGFDALGSLTNDANLTLSGTGEIGSTVEVFDGLVSLGTVLVNGDGAWTLTPETALADGQHVFSAIAVDAAGNFSDASATLSLEVDTTADAGAPAALLAPQGLVEPTAAKAVAYTVTGLDADATAVATFTDGVVSVSAEVAQNGNLVVDLSTLVNGKVASSLAITDAAGNTAEATGEVAAFVRADENPFVDDLYYLLHNPDVAASGMDPDEHYAQFGWKEGRDPSAVFSTVAYLSANRDVAEAGLNPLEHFLQYGEKEGRDPSAGFDVQAYLDDNPDVAEVGMGAMEHYLLYGRDEGRAAYAEETQTMVTGFDADYYLAANPDVEASGMDALQHFLQYGLFEGRQPSAELLG